MAAAEEDARFPSEVCDEFIALIRDDELWGKADTSQKGLEIFTAQREGEPITFLRGRAEIPTTAKAVFEFIKDSELCMRILDPMCYEFEIVEQVDEVRSVLYGIFQTPFPLANRDFVWAAQDVWREDEQIGISCGISVEHDDKPDNVPGVVRGELRTSGYFMQTNKDKENTCIVNYVVLADPKGFIPVWVVNLVVKDQAKNLIRLKEYFEKKNKETQAAGGD